jgi:hypothetical protein
MVPTAVPGIDSAEPKRLLRLTAIRRRASVHVHRKIAADVVGGVVAVPSLKPQVVSICVADRSALRLLTTGDGAAQAARLPACNIAEVWGEVAPLPSGAPPGDSSASCHTEVSACSSSAGCRAPAAWSRARSAAEWRGRVDHEKTESANPPITGSCEVTPERGRRRMRGRLRWFGGRARVSR